MSKIDRATITMHPLYEFLTEYKELNSDNKYRPVAVGRYGIRTRESIYSKELAKDYSKNKLIYKGTLTVGMGSVQMDIGILSDNAIYSVSPAYHTYKIAGIDFDYLRYCLQYRNMDMFVRYMKRGSRQGKSIDLGRWITYEIPVYPTQTQNAIVNRLNKVQKIINARQRELSALDDLIKARFVEMFGDPIINPFGLPMKKLSELGSLDRGRSQHRPRNASELLGGPYPLIQTGEVSAAGLYITEYHNTYSELGLKQSKMWKAGTLCITIAANIAQTSIMTFDACFPDSVVGFVPYGEVDALYMHYWFGFFQKILEDQAPQVAQKNINLKILADLNVIVPEKKTLNQFASFITQVDKFEFAIKKALNETQLLFDSLMQEYYR